MLGYCFYTIYAAFKTVTYLIVVMMVGQGEGRFLYKSTYLIIVT